MIVSWIRHPGNASSTGKVLKIQHRMGAEGIGIYWLCFEAFLRTGGSRRKDEELINQLAFELRLEKEQIAEFLRHAIDAEIISEIKNSLVFNEVALEIQRSEQVARKKSIAGSRRWEHVHSTCIADAEQVHSTESDACIVDKIREEKKREEEKREREKDPPVVPPIQISEAEKKSLLTQMSEDELAYWARCIGLYRLRRPETVGDHDWAAIQRWRERAIADGHTWNAAKKTYLSRKAQDPPDDRARIADLKERLRREEAGKHAHKT